MTSRPDRRLRRADGSLFEEAPSIENGAEMRKSPKFSPEVIERAVRMAFDAKDQYPSQWAAIQSISAKFGCTAETLRKTNEIPKLASA